MEQPVKVRNPKSLPPIALAFHTFQLDILKREAEFTARHPEPPVRITNRLLTARPK